MNNVQALQLYLKIPCKILQQAIERSPTISTWKNVLIISINLKKKNMQQCKLRVKIFLMPQTTII